VKPFAVDGCKLIEGPSERRRSSIAALRTRKWSQQSSLLSLSNQYYLRKSRHLEYASEQTREKVCESILKLLRFRSSGTHRLSGATMMRDNDQARF
jgi:hypothetical protein